MNVLFHSLSAIPFVLTHHYDAAVACLAPDLIWLPLEYRFRTSGIKNWYEWSKCLSNSDLVLYRLVHSLLIIFLVGFICIALNVTPWFCLGWAVHVSLDLPSHGGIMQPRPLYPFNWKWPNALTFNYIKRRNKNKF